MLTKTTSYRTRKKQDSVSVIKRRNNMFGVSLCSIGLLLIALFHTGKDIERNFLCNIFSNWRYNIQYCVFLISVTLCLHIFTAVTKRHLVMGGVGHTVILPCLSSLEGSCSDIRWFHETKSGTTLIASISRREDANTGRFNIVSNCSLHINNITEVDVGIYWCGKESGDFHFLSLITGE